MLASDYVFFYLMFFSFTQTNAAGVTARKKAMSLQRLTALRALMAGHPTALAAYIIPTADAHNSEYISPADARREWISGFTGSAGTAVVTANKALVWTDGRYYTQFEKEADLTMWTLMKQSLPETPTMEKWLASNLIAGSVVGVDPHTMTREEWTPLQVDSSITNISGRIEVLALKRLHLRLQGLRILMKWIRLLIYKYNDIFLFWSGGRIPDDIERNLSDEGVKIVGRPYDDVIEGLSNLARELSNMGDGEHSVWISNEASEAVHRAVSGEGVLKNPLNLISEVSPVALAKLVKNDVELEGFRKCHIRDGTAVCRFFRWLHQEVDSGNKITEVEAAERLLEFRKDEKDFMGPSFETISGAGENGAVIHYTPSSDSPRIITADDVYLLDSGGQYKDGTTDITRTRHMSDPTDLQKETFTRVLKGQIAIGAALYPVGVKGNVLDSLARKYLWDVGLDYAHGTGHGVGHFLNVHEGPSGISWRPYPHDPGLKMGQILSNEPGYYRVGEFGIRIEDLVETISVTNDTNHPRAKDLLGDYNGRGVLGFNTITLVPNQRKFIKTELLDDFEVSFLSN
nr:xaa-Pro aminopeptidase 1-like [Danaus plexippus plexippus]